MTSSSHNNDCSGRSISLPIIQHCLALSSTIHRVQVTGIIRETADTKTFVLRPLDGWKPVYAAGQFLTLVFRDGDEEERRSYSVSSAIVRGEPLSITVKKVDNGLFSRYLLGYITVGDVLSTTGFSGLFCLPQVPDEYENYFFLAAGSGIIPCYALIRALLATTSKRIILVYSNHTPKDTIFYEQLKTLQQENKSRFELRFLFSDSGHYRDARLSKPLLQEFLLQYLRMENDSTMFYTCGPELYMQVVIITLITQGIKKENIRRESFDSRPRAYMPKPPDEGLHLVTINFHGRVYHLVSGWPHSILATAKTQQVSIPYSCEAGRCGSCVATCVSGKVWMAYNEVLTDDELARGMILTCQAFPIYGPVEIVV